ncbi:MAG: Na/Pi cotransporter family protein [Bdellovibrionaceae bacterium]|nr:Na/Pi cotransporter family protein [Pseudobdellovibrionaceae bacterium]
MVHSSVVLFFGGVALFIYGLQLAGDNLQKLSAETIRDAVRILANKPYWGVFLGIGLTMVFQSSGAVTSMLVGLGAAKIISLQQIMSLILGTAIGSTFTVQILSFNISQFGLPIFILGFFIQYLSRRRVLIDSMNALMGMGMVFWGLSLIKVSTKELGDTEMFSLLLRSFSENPALTILFTSAFTAVVHSSAVTIGLAMTLVGHHYISLGDSVYWIFGANIGTTATALIASIGSNSMGRQVAWAHCLYKIAGVLLFYPFAENIANFMVTDSPLRDVANINTFYNCVAALLFYPWIKYGARLIEKIVPLSGDEKEFSVQFLKKTDWETPSIVLAHAERELYRMSDIVIRMIDQSLNVVRKNDQDLVAELRKSDDRADILSRELNLYLAQQLEAAPRTVQLDMIRLMNFAADLEAAADVVDNQIIELAAKTHTLKVSFPNEGWKDLEDMASVAMKISEMSVACFQTKDKDLAAQVIFHKREARKMEHRMREAHITRLVKGSPESINSSSIHLDLLGEYRRIIGLMSNHVYVHLKDSDTYNILPRRF